MAQLYIQSGNSLVARIARWTGNLPTLTSLTVTSVASGVITTNTNPQSTISIGDFIGVNQTGSLAWVTAVSSTTVTVNDPDAVFPNTLAAGTPIYQLDPLTNAKITESIQMSELKMRKLELPALRTDPYNSTSPTVLTVDSNSNAPIPADMNFPILFFQDSVTGVSPSANNLGPWIIYDRVGDREIIRRRMIDQLYVRPFGVPRVIRASFSEVGPNYVFTPNPGAGTVIKAYYIRTFPFLFGPTNDAANPFVQNNAVLATFPEGYFYGALEAYYEQAKQDSEAGKWLAKFDDAYGVIEDQNYRGKWKGGDQHLTSEWQPRNYRYSFK